MANPKYTAFWTSLLESDTDDCIEYPGYRNQSGYGLVRLRRPRRNVSAHRLAYERAIGAIPKQMNVCHHCDNPPCCNPRHLFLGTQRDNLQDASRKGRVLGPRKLTETDLLKVRQLLDQGLTHSAISKKFNVSRSTISRIALGATYKSRQV